MPRAAAAVGVGVVEGRQLQASLVPAPPVSGPLRAGDLQQRRASAAASLKMSRPVVALAPSATYAVRPDLCHHRLAARHAPTTHSADPDGRSDR